MGRMWSNFPRPDLTPRRWTRWRVAAGRRKAARRHGKPEAHGQRRILVDISVLNRRDAGTGIQRLVKSKLQELLSQPPQGYVIQPVAATKYGFYRSVVWRGSPAAGLDGDDLEPRAGDIFFGLDLCANIIPHHREKLIEWKRRGVTFIFVMYDLLPLQRPEWFPGRLAAAFRSWMPVVAILANEVKCISKAIAEDFSDWIYQRYDLTAEDISVSVMPIRASDWMPELIEDKGEAEPLFSGKGRFFLTVGTVEPRKGHADLLDAFELVWASQPDLTWVIVGQPGWRTSALQRRIKTHRFSGTRLFWFERATDSQLGLLYSGCHGVILPSYAEGLGLPVLEAMEMNRPVLARDLPVYQELRGAEKIQLFAREAGNREIADAICSFDAYCRDFRTVSNHESVM